MKEVSNLVIHSNKQEVNPVRNTSDGGVNKI